MRTASVGSAFLLAGLVAAGAPGAETTLRLPLGLDGLTVTVPDDNPLTAEKIALGKQIFWDKRLSGDGSVACVSCHLPEHGWADPRQFSVHVGGARSPRHSPTLVNRLFSERQGWAGSFDSLEDFTRRDVTRRDGRMVFQHLAAIPGYQHVFHQVFGTEVSADGIAQAVASYMRTILSGNSAYDRFRAGDQSALSPAARRGLGLFEGKARCVRCHAGPNFTDEGYQNLGVGLGKENPDLGRYQVTKREAHKGAFKTPTLRDVARRPPYMHDGSLRTLGEVIALYDNGGLPNPGLSPEIAPLHLTAEERDDLVAFLESLTGHVSADVSTPPILPP
jgi:cytochrome c peroxidase